MKATLNRVYSISLGPAHAQRLKQIQNKIRSTTEHIGNRSEAVQVALLAFAADDKIAELVEKNKCHDCRRKQK
jgi:flagellar biosynthesis/type III secretory pathway M-ring protein FliF/YscJ